MKERIIGVVMIVVILIGFASYSGTFAWISTTVEDAQLNADLTVGKMFSIEGELGSRYSMGNKKIMVPGENLIVRPLDEGETHGASTVGEAQAGVLSDDGYEPCKLSIKNDATIETQIRVKVEYSYADYQGGVSIIGSSGNLCVYGNSDSSFAPTDPNGRLQVQFTDDDKWVYDQTDGFWYYNPEEAESVDDDYLIIPANYNATDLIDYIRYDPVYYTETYAYNTWKDQSDNRIEVQVKLIVQAKQARYVDWGTLVNDVAELGA